MLVNTVQATLRRHAMLQPEMTVLVAVSGGIDSIVLLDVLQEIAGPLELRLLVAHLDHRLRPGAADDARFVRDMAEKRGIPLIAEQIDVLAFAQAHRLGVEEAARTVRRRFLEQAAADENAARIALGHTASDQAETILFQLTRGSGLPGMGGMPAVSPPYIRPLIGLAREAIQDYALRRGLVWREDESNADLTYSRNRIRHRVLPELSQINPNVVSSICSLGDLAREALDALDFAVDTLWKDLAPRPVRGGVEVSRRAVASLPPAVQSLVIRRALQQVRKGLSGIARSHIAAVRALLASNKTHGESHLPSCLVSITSDRIAFATERRPSPQPWSQSVSFGRTEIASGEGILELAIIPKGTSQFETYSADRWTEVADADRVHLPLEVRSRRAGDRFTPLGMTCDVGLKDFLIHQHVPRHRRDTLPLLCDRQRILWIPGVRLNERIKTTPSTERILFMKWEGASE